MNIGILASGGDGAGMNMFLCTLVNKLKNHNVTLFKFGYKGLIENITCNFDMKYLKSKKLKGGICIKTSRCPEFKTLDGQNKAIETLKKNYIDILVVMGGNGSFKGAKSIASQGIKIIFIPCSIDNDVFPSNYSIGYDTACSTCSNYINQVQDTMLSFDRLCIYEVMGRNCDAIAKKVAKMIDADFVYTDNSTTKDCIETLKKSKNSAPIVVLQENVLNIEDLANNISQNLNREVKSCVVGYIQRGGNPTKFECKIAHEFAVACAKQINEGVNSDIMFVQYTKNGVISKPI